MDKIATIIVHYNTPDDTNNALASLAKIRATQLDHQIYVIDNGSKEVYQPDQTYPNVHLFRSDTNLGFTGGNNLGFSRAKKDFNPDYYLLLNSDTLVKPDFLRHLLTYLDDHPKVGLVSPMIYFAPGYEYHQHSYTKSQLGKVIWFAGGVIDWPHLSAFHQGVDEVDRQQFSLYPSQPAFLSGCCWLMRREVYEVLGGFDERYFLYFEDTDFSLRVKKAGFQLGFCPASQIWHVNGGSGGGAGSDLQRYYQTRNRFIFYWTHGHLRARLTTLRLALQYLLGADRTLKIAAQHFFTHHSGKQVYI
jgi:GT2 family glycosyltransferase